jgi:signal transduction histidine kinase
MSSVIAAPVGGRIRRARTLEHDSAWEVERRRLRRHLRVSTLRALEEMATAPEDVATTAIVRSAGEAAAELREIVGELNESAGRSPVAELRTRVAGLLHDSTLQALEYLASDGYSADLCADTVRRIAADAAIELRGSLLRLGAPAHCELSSGLREVVAGAERRGDAKVHLVLDGVEGRLSGGDAEALVGAVREALNNVNKHAHASRVIVRCEEVDGVVRVCVHDDGVGADLAKITAGIGLRHSIVERMERRGGHADVASAPGRGMHITLTTAGPQEVAA